jgi:LysM repeat protein
MARLNPHLVQGETPPGKPFPVRIPHGRAETFAANWERVSAAAEIRQAAVREQKERERQAEARSRTASRGRSTARGTGRTASSRGTAARSRTHLVRQGESLWTIARRNDLTVAQLKRANNLRGNSVQPGQRLYIPRQRS